eukprot:TRINITY_DN24000_c0_g1_i1.p1 TRINITY_DN24000_c0_g1~~TRINITY_DN24000_c0_g1_i1.p1  ORF type:complete len:659 (-),score=87.46 TRINITY_DN24000_c0_g1_i1:255-2177(-)
MVTTSGELALHIVTFLIWTCGVAGTTYIICKRYMGSSENAAEDYFAGGRALKWYVIAGSLMLTNLSTEQLVGLNGAVFKDGCLVGIWWEAGASIAMVVTASLFLPRYMALGLTTTTGFLGERYDLIMRTLVSIIFLLYYAVVLCPLVCYTGALAIRNIFELNGVPLWVISTVIALLGAAYALFGGLKAVAVSDCLNGLGLILIGFWLPIAALQLLPNGFSSLFEEPSYLKPLVEQSQIYDDASRTRFSGIASVPWHVTFTGLTVANMYYWSTNQVIVQRVLAAESLAQGQKGVLFAAAMKVVGFAFLCIPGIVGILMVKHRVVINGEVFQVRRSDELYPSLVRAVMPTWSLGLFAAVLLGSVLSTFNSALNSATTIFGLEIYKIYINREAKDEKVVNVATIFGASLTVLTFVVAPQLENVDSIYTFLQRMNTVVSLPIVTIFFVGIATAMPDAFAAKVGFAVAVVACAIGQVWDGLHYLHLFFAIFAVSVFAMGLATYVPFIRRACCREPVPLAYSDAKNKALVDMGQWSFMLPIIALIMASLALLIVSLHLGSAWLFCTFWGFWGIVIVTLMALPSQTRSKALSSQDQSTSTPDLEQTGSTSLPSLIGRPDENGTIDPQAKASIDAPCHSSEAATIVSL